MRKSIEKVFGIEGHANRFLDQLFSIIALNLLFLAMSLPIITVGPALVALYQSMCNLIQQDDARIYRKFFRSFKQDFGRNFVLSILLIGYLLFLVINIQLFHYFVPVEGMFQISRIAFLAANVLLIIGIQCLVPYYSNLGMSLKPAVVLSVRNSYKQLPKVFIALLFLTIIVIIGLKDWLFLPLIILFCPGIGVYTKLRLMDYGQWAKESD